MTKRDETKMLATMRTLRDAGWHGETMLVDAAAETIGGDDKAKAAAQSIYDRHFKIFTAN